jgi:hypothetical membrane protein
MNTSVEPDRGTQAGPFVTVAAWAGIIGPLLFTAAFLTQEALRRDEFDPVTETVSALEAGPHGWVQQVNFVIFGVLTILFALGLHRAVPPTRRGIAGPAALAISGAGLVLAAVLPLREDAAGSTYDPGGHVVAGVLFFGTSAVGLVLLSARLGQGAGWQSLAWYCRAAGAVALLGFVVMGSLVMPDDAPLHDWAGVFQRALIVGVVFPCRMAIGVRMLRLSHGRTGPTEPTSRRREPRPAGRR